VASEVVRKRIVVRGRVQGVFFRDTVRERARAHDVAGWVHNRGDGALEAVFEGAPDDVDRLIRFCETGPPRARVQDVEVREEHPAGAERFEVR
jgi:acylphosphatase